MTSKLTASDFTAEAAGSGHSLAHVQGPHTLARYERTSVTQVYEHAVIPGPLQVPSYTAVLMAGWAKLLGTQDAPRHAADAHHARSQVLLQRPRELHAIVEERALRTVVGSWMVMAVQLGRLLQLADEPNVHLRVIPQDACRSVVPSCGFWLLTSPGEVTATATTEVLSASLWTDDEKQVELYDKTWERLGTIAMGGRAAAALITRALEALVSP